MSAPQEPLRLDAIRQIPDDATAIRALATYIALAEEKTRTARTLRDERIRSMRRHGATIPTIAAQTGINIATVKAVLR